MELLYQKGEYPYSYVKKFEVFEESSLPTNPIVVKKIFNDVYSDINCSMSPPNQLKPYGVEL